MGVFWAAILAVALGGQLDEPRIVRSQPGGSQRATGVNVAAASCDTQTVLPRAA